MNILEELFYVYEESVCNDAINESWKKCREELNIVPDKYIDNVTNSIHEYTRECERIGFENGFYYGASLMIEIMSRSSKEQR